MTLVASASIEAPTGWIDLVESAGYELHAEFRGNRGVTHRRTEVSNEWVEGSYTTRSVRENIVENVSLYVRADTHHELWERIEAITDAFDQLSYQMKVTYGDSQETWNCQVADYQLEVGKELSHATMAVIKASVPRLPTLTREQVSV